MSLNFMERIRDVAREIRETYRDSIGTAKGHADELDNIAREMTNIGMRRDINGPTEFDLRNMALGQAIGSTFKSADTAKLVERAGAFRAFLEGKDDTPLGLPAIELLMGGLLRGGLSSQEVAKAIHVSYRLVPR